MISVTHEQRPVPASAPGRGFSFQTPAPSGHSPRPFTTMSDARKPFPFRDFEPQWQARWESEKTFRTPGPGDAGFDPAKPKFYVLDMFPYPSGSRPARRPPGRLHRHRHHRPLQAHDRPQRAAPDGLRFVRPARRAIRHQDRPAPGAHHRRQHRELPPPAEIAGFRLRLGPRNRHHRSRIRALDAVDLPPALSFVFLRGGTTRPSPSANSKPRAGPASKSTRSASPTSPTPRSGGRPTSAPCSPTRKSRSGKPKATPSSAARCASGCCASRNTPSA